MISGATFKGAIATGNAGAHRVEGTAAGFWPPHLVDGSFDEAPAIDEDEGRAIARRAAREERIFAGLKYLAGDLYKA